MILTPTCPLCGGLPAFVLDDGHQCFCPDDGCQVLAWDSHKSREWLLANRQEMRDPAWSEN